MKAVAEAHAQAAKTTVHFMAIEKGLAVPPSQSDPLEINFGCCGRWYECGECHDEAEEHNAKLAAMVAFTCVHCKGVFQKDLRIIDSSDKGCPHCGNVFDVQAETPDGQLAAHARGILAAELDEVLTRF
eukprot:14736-Heterococcus_DN1.PRE.1